MGRKVPQLDVIKTIGYEITGEAYLKVEPYPFRKVLEIHNGGEDLLYVVIGGSDSDLTSKVLNKDYMILHAKGKWRSSEYLTPGEVFIGMIDHSKTNQVGVVTDSAVSFKRQMQPLQDRWDDNRIYQGVTQWQ